MIGIIISRINKLNYRLHMKTLSLLFELKKNLVVTLLFLIISLISHAGEKKLNDLQTIQTTSSDSQVTISEIEKIQNELSLDLNTLQESVKLKDSEIERLNQEISNLQTLVQIESLKAELANLKTLASKRK